MMSTATLVSAQPAADLFPVPLEPRVRRLESMDMLRGLLMILMALDHTRDYFSNIQVNPVDPLHSWPLLFATRWVTHLCAPGFIALAGASVYLQQQRGKTPAELRRLLLTRGLWLVFMELTVVGFGWSFGFVPFLQVIWAVGVSMMALGLLMGLPRWAIGGIGAAIMLLHNLLDRFQAASFGHYKDLWELIHEGGLLTVHGRVVGMAFYPVLPWFGIICLGYAFGAVAGAEPATRRRISMTLAACFGTAFVLLRALHGYGDPIRFQVLTTPAQTAMSFLNVQKYPPSLEYALATFTVLLLLYAAFDLAASRDLLRPVRGVLETYGRVPFFYYVPHIYLLHALALLGIMAEHGNWHLWVGPGYLEGNFPAGWGFGLPVVYAVWIGVVALLYWPCIWFSGLKARRRDWWLSYL